jgi:hypothetical protein
MPSQPGSAGEEVFNTLNTDKEIDYKALAEPHVAQVARKGAQDQQNVAQEQPVIPLAEPVNPLPPAYDIDRDGPRPEDGAVVVHAQFSAPPLSPRSVTLLSQLDAVQATLTAELAKKTEAEALEDASVFTGLLVNIHALKRTVRGQQPQSTVSKNGVQRVV